MLCGLLVLVSAKLYIMGQKIRKKHVLTTSWNFGLLYTNLVRSSPNMFFPLRNTDVAPYGPLCKIWRHPQNRKYTKYLTPPEEDRATSSSSSSLCGLSSGRCRFYERPPCLSILCSMIASCQTNVEWSNICFNCAEPSLTRLAWSAVPVPWQGVHTLDLSARLWSMDGSARSM